MTVKRKLFIAGIVVGSLLTLSPFVALFGTVLGMTRAFKTLGSSGIADPQALSDSISMTLHSTAAGFILFLVGIVVLSLSLVFYFRDRASTPPPLPQRPT